MPSALPIPGFSQAFFKQPPSPAEPVSQGISFPCFPKQTLDQFVAAHLEQFENEFMARVACINQFALLHLSETSAETVCAAFDQLAERLFDTAYDFFSGQKEILYGTGKRSLDLFAEQLPDPNLDIDVRRNTLMELAAGIQECAPGAARSLGNATQAFDLARGNQFFRAKDEAVMTSIIEAYGHLTGSGRPVEVIVNGETRLVSSIPEVFEGHYVISLRNALAESLGLARQTDPTSEIVGLPSESIAYCGAYVARHLTPARLALKLAEEYMETMRQAVLPAKAEAHDPHRVFDYERISPAVNTIRDMLKSHGDIDLRSVFTPLDDDFEQVRFNADPALVARDILEQQRRNGLLANSYLPETVAHWQRNGKSIGIRHMAGQFAWAVENNTAKPLSTKHLRLIRPKDFSGREHIPRLIAATVIKNTPPKILQANLSPEWLSIANAAEVFSKWSPGELTHYLKRNQTQMIQLPLNRRRSIAKGIVACGSATDLDLCIHHGRIMFEPPTTGVHPPPYFRIALLRGDPVMLNKLLNLFEAGKQKSANIRALAAMILASADENGTPALADALSRRQRNAALAPYFRILTHAAIGGTIDSDQLEHLLIARRHYKMPALLPDDWSALHGALANGAAKAVEAFGDALMYAIDRGALSQEQVIHILQGPALMLQNMHEDIVDEDRLVAALAFIRVLANFIPEPGDP